MIRSPIICVMGHVDHGKTALLDAIRGSAVTKGEAGAITQHVGASFISTNVIEKESSEILKKYGYQLKIPGLLFIDTPGHEAFTSLRKRGGKTADLAILVVDITQGVQPQTKEAIQILKEHKCPLIIAANKVDLIQGWNPNKGEPFTQTIKKQSKRAKENLENRLYSLIGEIAGQGFNSQRFDKVKNPEKTFLIIPVSAETKEGIPELLMFLAGLSQKYLKENLEIDSSEPGEGTILEVKKTKGLGTTLDVILYKGTLKKGDKVIVATKKEAIETKIKALLEPKELKEMREAKDAEFERVEKVTAAAGVKISAQDIGEVIPGSPIIAVKEGEEQKTKQEVEAELDAAEVRNPEEGVIIKADTIGSLEAMISLFKKSEIPIRRAEIGKVNKKDITEAKSIKEKNRYLGAVFAFSTIVPDDIEKRAKESNVPLFQSKVIYELEKNYKEWKDEEKEREKEERLEKYTYPAKIKILPEHVFRKSKPAVVGVKIHQGKIKPGYMLMNNEGTKVGKIKSIQKEEHTLDIAEEGDEVAISIENATVGRQIKEEETLYTAVPVIQTYELQKEGFKNETLLREIRNIQRGE